jgi:hypothetical protein
MEGGTLTFVTHGIGSALEQAKKAAGGLDVLIGGGAHAVEQYLAAGMVDEFELHIVRSCSVPASDCSRTSASPNSGRCARSRRPVSPMSSTGS